MPDSSQVSLVEVLDAVFRRESRRVYASLVRLLGDWELAEEAMHEAFAAAAEKWGADGVPENPRAWLVSTGRNKAIDLVRREARFRELQSNLVTRFDQVKSANQTLADREIEDDRLRLIFTCCHPAIDPKVQVPLTLREVCGLTTEEIASAFLTSPATMAQRIVRGKAKIRAAKIPLVIPEVSELSERLDAVLSVIYLVFNEGYSASSGDELIRKELSGEAIRLARLLLQLLNEHGLGDVELHGLLALMLLHESRREARLTPAGEIVLLEDQDRQLWDRVLIDEGKQLVAQALATRNFGAYTLQAAISAAHADAAAAEETNWAEIVGLYDLLLQAQPSPVVELNRAVAVAMRDGPASGLEQIDAILERGELTEYHLAHSSRGELLRRCHRQQEARTAFEQALRLAKIETEQQFLRRKIAELESC